METAKLDWKTFTARRRLNVKLWIKSKGFKKHSDLVEWCKKEEIIPPSKDEVSDAFKKPPKKKLVEKVKEIKEEPKKETKKKKSRKTKKVDTPSES